ncbi:ABC transporter substrate-binding protein [Nonomuraea angiospora]|uniref:ABC transporter substrate-binding protein n=1 Tax=Nonomuraea angiospora TaxID=46172 RepID=UPI0029B1F358|nr:hypothetical protein [Nonomuraea angiospora]MDX3109611.1 hypothetical protein [Nonomuraea angiospora]
MGAEVAQHLNAALAELVILRRFRRRKVRFGRRTGPLVFQLEPPDDHADDHAAGLEAIRSWPAEYYEEYSSVLPINEPCKAPPNAGLSQFAAELRAVAHRLSRPAYRLPLVFPRFEAAYALVDWDLRDPEQKRLAELGELDAELEEKVKQAIDRARQKILREVRKAIKKVVTNSYLGNLASGIVGLVIGIFGAFRVRAHWTLRWYRKKAFRRPLGTTEELVRELRRLLIEPGDEPSMTHVDEKELLLVKALLADIDAHHGLFRRLNRVRRPVILLPDVDLVPARRKIRDTLLAAYDHGSRGLRVHPVVVATSARGGAPVARGANPPVSPGELAKEIPALFARRKETIENIIAGGAEQVPSRLLPVTLGSGPAPKPPRRGPGPLTLTTEMFALAGVLVFLTYAVILPPPEPASCGEGLVVMGGDCIGVSDGTGVLMPELDGMPAVFARIEAENNRIAAKAYATVALMIPLQSDIPAVRRQILSEVQGAYLAQLQANAPDAAKPPIRLVLANPGRDYRYWQRTVNYLTEREPRLRVVAGFNLSLTSTWDAMHHLTKDLGIPVVAGLVTSSDFANPETQDRSRDPFPGLARVVSTTKEQAEALLKSDPKLAGAESALVADTRPLDNYDKSLRDAFTEARKGKKGTGVQDMTYESPGLEEPGRTPNRFQDFALNICQSNARFVYFAGRAYHLKLFVKTLANTYCSGKKSYTVITGSDATTLDSRLDAEDLELIRGDPGGGRPSVSVEYAAPAHPGAWNVEVEKWWRKNTREGSKPKREDLPRYLAEPQESLARLQRLISTAKIGPVALEDGRTIVTHDVVLTAYRALAKAVAISATEVPTRQDVKDVLADLHAAYRIQGASGLICLTGAGNPYDKALPVVRLDPASGKLTFKGVAWPEGKPPNNNCVVPQ